MADIFGREIADYKHLQEDRITGGDVRKYLRGRADFMRNALLIPDLRPHNFDALDPARMGFARNVDSDNTFAYMQSNLESFTGVVDEELFLSYRTPEYIPTNTSMPEGADTIPVRARAWRGRPERIPHDGSAVPNVGVSERRLVINSDFWGIEATVNDADLMRSMLAGFPLDTESTAAATQACEARIFEVAMTGAGWGEIKGLVNQPTGANAVTNTAPSGANFAGNTGDQWEQDIQEGIRRVIATTNGMAGVRVTGELVIMVDAGTLGLMAKARISNTDVSVLSYIEANNAWNRMAPGNRITFKECQYCDASQDQSPLTKDRIVIYPNHRSVVEIFELIRPRLNPMVRESYGYKLPFLFQVSELHVARPEAICYITDK